MFSFGTAELQANINGFDDSAYQLRADGPGGAQGMGTARPEPRRNKGVSCAMAVCNLGEIVAERNTRSRYCLLAAGLHAYSRNQGEMEIRPYLQSSDGILNNTFQ